SGAECQRSSLGSVQVTDVEVEVRLHGRRGVRPDRWSIPGRALEAQLRSLSVAVEPGPVLVAATDGPAGDLAVKPRQCRGLGALEHDATQFTNCLCHVSSAGLGGNQS